MAGYFTDFSEYTVDTSPGDFTQRWHSGYSGIVRDDVRGSNGRVLETVMSGSSRRLYTWDKINADPDRDQVEILIRWMSPASSAADRDFRVSVRAMGGDTNETGYTAGFTFNTNEIRHGYYNEGSFTDLGADNRVLSEDVWHYQKVRLQNSALKTKVWTGTLGDEPLIWAIEDTDVALTSAGWVGLFSFSNGSGGLIDFIGVGTNGDPAPTGPVTGGTDSLTANDISSTSQVSSPAIAQTHALTANDVSSLSSVGSPAIGQTHSLIATDVQSTSEVSSPALATQANTDNLTANDISSTSTTSSPALGQVHNLAANDTTSASETGTPTLQQTHALTSVYVSSLSTVSSPALTSVAGQDSLAANDVQATSTVSSPTIGQVHNLTANDLSSASETDSPTLGQVHALTANGLASTSEVSSPTLRDASQVLATPIKNTRATVSQTTYKAAIIQPVYKAEAG